MSSTTQESLTLSAGIPHPVGVTCTESGTGWNFVVVSQHADSIDLCLFENPDDRSIETRRIRLSHRTGDFWHIAVEGIVDGTQYGYRAHGAFLPEFGHVFNPKKLLLDPYARRLDSLSQYHPSFQGVVEEAPEPTDSGPFAPKGVLSCDNESFDWEGDRPLPRKQDELVIYEMHVKGFSQTNPDVPENLRGTYSGLAHQSSIDYLKRLGITAVQLLPVHQHLDDSFLLERGLVNYWGYNTLSFFAPETRYAATNNAVTEFKAMVKTLHAEGIRVILDVVYNHTCEAGIDGPMLSLRGFDNAVYYRSQHKNPGKYEDVTGCGNTVDLSHTQSLKLVLDSLRYWVEEMHVDGFRFDLAVTLGREPRMFNPRSAFFKAIFQDPVLSKTLLIAEPWDLGRGGYQVGSFPSNWSELNGKFRDCVRRFWKGDRRILGELAGKITGSEDLYRHNGRTPLCGINFVTSHDGFPLRDLFTYNEKHNEANGEENRDGDDHNLSRNFGCEGETGDEGINAVRFRQIRNFFVTMIFSRGVPFIYSGDEKARTQGGNNNAYCQDNEISWFDWNANDEQNELTEFVAELIRFRTKHPILTRDEFFSGIASQSEVQPDVRWLRRDGSQMEDNQWNTDNFGCLGVLINNRPNETRAVAGSELPTFILVMFNASNDEHAFQFPQLDEVTWTPVIDTREGRFLHNADPVKESETQLVSHSCRVFTGK